MKKPKSKKYTDSEIQTILDYISERERLSRQWLFFNVGTDKHVGTRIPAKFINSKEQGDYINSKTFEVKEKIYYYRGYDALHRQSDIKNFYYDTKENIINYLKSQCEFEEGTSEEEIDEYIESMFQCYTNSAKENENRNLLQVQTNI